MAYSARFCYLAAALWAPQSLANWDDNGDDGREEYDGGNTGSQFMWYLVYALFFLGTVRVIQVTQNKTQHISILVALISHGVFNAVHHIDWILHLASF